ncbi:MAG TPA: alpha-isopropylmalate synthase regulatory domain-containing protein [Prolixibacteraceae bacterium]|nr:alpha-isopropylmalate synthase regulatory domain-containing protein [Prolixibacteraceae bacterium]
MNDSRKITSSQSPPLNMGGRNNLIKIMDTTLRDGEQTTGVSFNEMEKMSMAKVLLSELKVDRIEVASARVSEGEFKGVKRITEWANKNSYIDRIEVLGFVDNGVSIDWIVNAGAKVLNLLIKGSFKHVTEQLRRTPDEHLDDTKRNIRMAREKGLTVNVYLEDWSNGMRHSNDYVHFMLKGLMNEGINRFMLPDTLGILNPDETYQFCKEVVDAFPQLNFDFHPHNDYDLAIANTFNAIKAGITCIHTTINGLGERAGNAPLSSVIATIKDHMQLQTNVDESKLNMVSKLVESFSGIRIPTNKPLIGEFVFTQCSGVHADGDTKNNLYFNDLLPERFGRERKYALGKTSGKANIKKNLEAIGINLDADSLKKVTERVIELSDKKDTVTAEDLPYIVADVLRTQSIKQVINILNYSISLAYNLKPVASVAIKIKDKVYEDTAPGDGQYDAFMNVIKKIYKRLRKPLPQLTDYAVTIPPGGKTDAFVETLITWQGEKEFRTRGLDSDQTTAAIKATMKMLNIIEQKIQ